MKKSVVMLSFISLFSFFIPLQANATITYATWNPSDKGSDITLSNGNLTATKGSGTNWTAVRATIAPPSGKWYWEITAGVIAGNGQDTGFGTASAAIDGSIGPYDNNTQGHGYRSSGGEFVTNSTVTATSSSWTTGDIIGVAYDADAGKLWWAKNGTWANSGNPAAGTGAIYTGTGANLYPVWSGEINTNAVTVNFGTTTFVYSAPSGFNSGLYATTNATSTVNSSRSSQQPLRI